MVGTSGRFSHGAGVCPLVNFVEDTLTRSGCDLLDVECSENGNVRLSCETPLLQRVGLVGHLVLIRPHGQDRDGATATVHLQCTPTGGNPCERDPFGLYTPFLLGIDLARSFFIAFDPQLHAPQDEPLAVAISGAMVGETLRLGWHAWLREGWEDDEWGFAEVLIGFTRQNLLRYLLFESLAAGLDTGPRERLAELFFEEVARGRGRS